MKSPENSLARSVALIVGSPAALAERCRREEDLRSLGLAAVGLLLVGCSAFGFLLGWTRSPLQAFYAGIKLPLAWLLTLVVCTPAYYALAAVSGESLRFRALCTAVLVATGRASAVLLGLLPVLWIALCLASDDALDYHRLVGVAVILYAGSGLAALGVMRHLLRGGLLVAAAAALFLLVGGQSAWTFRPFVGRPADTHVPFLRPAEDTFLETLPRALRSATGDYDRVAPHSSRSFEGSHR